MANARRIYGNVAPPAPRPWDVPGPAVVCLELDRNEADAVEYALSQRDLTPTKADALPTAPGSLRGAGARVFEALRAVGV